MTVKKDDADVHEEKGSEEKRKKESEKVKNKGVKKEKRKRKGENLVLTHTYYTHNPGTLARGSRPP